MQKRHCVTDYRDKNYNKEDIYFYDFFRVAAIKKIYLYLVHQKVKSHQCDICGKKLTQKSILKKHILTKHSNSREEL